MGSFEFAIDAPWRLEPSSSTPRTYGPIPIIVSIHDASMQFDPGTSRALGRVSSIVVREESAWEKPVTRFTSDQFFEIERSNKWPYTSDAPIASHKLCRVWAGENCADVLDVGTAAEWFATVLYTPKHAVAGSDVRLSVQVTILNSAGGGPAQPDPYAGAVSSLHSGKGARLYSRLLVHAGEQPLPRFGAGWVYGDLHYHSQGTDNEGESAHSFRGVIQAMRAMGMDFLFATDHASSSPQVTDIDFVFLDYLTGNKTVDDYIINQLKKRLPTDSPGVPISSVDATRDLTPARFAHLRDWLNRSDRGVNSDIALTPGHRFAPQIFLGAEVDVVPEVSGAEVNSGVFFYGNHKPYNIGGACKEVPDFFKAISKFTDLDLCPEGHWSLLDQVVDGGATYKVKDIQGPGARYFARQHFVHLPTDPMRDDAFVESRTTEFGGATKRLKDVLATDYAQQKKGYLFLAHPVDAAGGSGSGRLGPDMIPYSDAQLEVAFGSEYVLGLELWNEDSRLHSKYRGCKKCKESFPVGGPYKISDQLPPGEPADRTPDDEEFWRWGESLGSRSFDALHHGTFAWDKMLLWGLAPSKRAGLTWLPVGQPRRVFMAGGSDAHGDLNYRQESRIEGFTEANDTAIGKPRNLLFIGTPDAAVADASGGKVPAVAQAEAIEGLKSGNFVVTDGPILRIVYDANTNGVVDDADLPMGSVTSLKRDGTLPLLVEWKSTEEFGAVTTIDLYVGAQSSAHAEGVVYAPLGHGVRGAESPSGSKSPRGFRDPRGVVHWEMVDHYMLDPSGKLRFTVPPGKGLGGTTMISLRAAEYVVGTRMKKVIPSRREPNCHEDVGPGRPDPCIRPPVVTTTYDNPVAPDSIYVRAFAKTAFLATPFQCIQNTTFGDVARRSGKCIERLAFANPIWAKPLRDVIGPLDLPRSPR